jgi:hypothetical protein
MTDVLLMTTSAAWRSLNRLCADTSRWQVKGGHKAQLHALNYLSIAPYSTADPSHHLSEVANIDIMAACNLCLYRASLLFAYKHIISKDYQKAHEDCNQAIMYLQEGLNLLDFESLLHQNDIKYRARHFVNNLASQAELHEARRNLKIASHLVFILGMHRSGTSALTGMLAQAGFAVPSDLMGPTEANPKGYWESVSIMNLNENFLTSMESRWFSSLPLPSGWCQSIHCRDWRTSLIKTICKSFGAAERTTIKDPRFCTLIFGLEPWMESQLIETSFYIPIRHPLEVSNSLHKAEGIKLNQALRLWIHSVISAEKATRGYRRMFIDFENLINNPLNILESCLELIETSSSLEASGRSLNSLSEEKSKSLSHAVAFIDKGLKRQHPVISEKEVLEVNNASNAKLIDLAERTFLAILANIPDNLGISNALDELMPSLTNAL